jgi:hypothetical protein
MNLQNIFWKHVYLDSQVDGPPDAAENKNMPMR